MGGVLGERAAAGGDRGSPGVRGRLGVPGYRGEASVGYGGGSSSTRPPSLCWIMMSGPASSTGGSRNDEPARRGTGCCGKARNTAADCERCTGTRPEFAPGVGSTGSVLDRDGPTPARARAACASACASRALRYLCAGVNVAAGDVEFGVSIIGDWAAAGGGETGVRAIDMDRDTADTGACDAGEIVVVTVALLIM